MKTSPHLRCVRALSAVFISSVLSSMPALAADPSKDVYDLNDLRVKITERLPYLKVKHKGREVIVMRHQDPAHTIEPPFDQTARDCPPFCVQPMRLHPGVETIGELELLDYLRRVSDGDTTVMVIDSRTEAFTQLGTIPGSVNVPYTKLDPAHATPKSIAELLQFDFDAVYHDGLWNFNAPKTLVFFCNGPWCGQSPSNIKFLLNLGYPSEKLKWYRGGMQAWEELGFTTVRQ